MKVSTEERELVRLALLSAFVVQAQLPPELVRLLDTMTKPAPRARRRIFRRR